MENTSKIKLIPTPFFRRFDHGFNGYEFGVDWLYGNLFAVIAILWNQPPSGWWNITFRINPLPKLFGLFFHVPFPHRPITYLRRRFFGEVA